MTWQQEKEGAPAMALTYEPCRDSGQRAAAARRTLDIHPENARELGRSALEIITRQWYVNPRGEQVDLSDSMEAANLAKLSVPADADLPPARLPAETSCTVSVRNESALTAAADLAGRHARVLVLNMGDGAFPGGGWLSGSKAQEEALCRSSTLYRTIEHDPMYPAHRRRDDRESTHAAILSPYVSVFRDDAGNLLDAPWTMDVITCAAPVARSVGQPRSGELLQQRIDRILDIAASYGYEALVLGAWGCGAFGNDGHRTAADFHAALRNRSGSFREVVFAITDWSPERRFLGPFREELRPTG